MIATKNTYILILLIAVVFAASQIVPWLRTVGIALDVTFLALLFIDYQLTPRPKLLSATREIADRYPLAGTNDVTITIFNHGTAKMKCLVKDDFPPLLNADVQQFEFELPAEGYSKLVYAVAPNRRGCYQFDNINVRYRSYLGLSWRQVGSKQNAK